MPLYPIPDETEPLEVYSLEPRSIFGLPEFSNRMQALTPKMK